jgi:Mn-dependent DtxR family transcriptional regulator
MEADNTPRQLEYLLYLGQAYSGRGRRTLTEIAERFGVSKPTALATLAHLERRGLAARGSDGAELTRAGRETAAPLLTRAADISEWLRDFLMLPSDEAEREAATLVCAGPPSVTEHILRHREIHLAESNLRRSALESAGREPGGGLGSALAIPDGRYDVDFTVLKNDGSGDKSMGDRGFLKPARLTVHAGSSSLELWSKMLRHKASRLDASSRGSLRRLWYFFGKVWEEAPRTRGTWHIPGGAIAFTNGGGDISGRVAIRVRAGGAACAMPDSEAIIMLTLRGAI